VPLDLVLPHLLDAPTALRMPALERWIARGEQGALPAASTTELLARAYGFAGPIPVAAVTLAGDGHPDVRAWLRADPVHLELVQDGVALRDAAVLDVTRDEASLLVAELQGLFASDGFEFLSPAPQRWYVRVPPGEVPSTVPLQEAVGRNVFGMLPRGTGRVNWPSALTEVQMLFSTHAVNARREARGQPAINSVWFWGEGGLPGTVPAPYAIVHAEDAFARGLAILSSTRVLPVPKALADVDAVRPEESVLVVLDGPANALRRGDPEGWRRSAEALDDAWFVPLRSALERFDRVNLFLPRRDDTLTIRLEPRARWRFFRRSRPLSAHA
jgi:hypothetical protein